MVTHVANYHAAEGAVPCKSWLKLMSQWVCGHCMTLHSSKRSRSNEDCFAVSPSELSTIPSDTSALIPRTPQRQRIPPQRVLFNSPVRPQATVPMGTPMSAHWIHGPALNNILGKNIALLRHVPQGAINACGKGLAQQIQGFLASRSWEAFEALMTYHKCTLAIPHRGGHKNKNEACRLVRARVLIFEAEGWLKCWNAVEGARSQPNRTLKKLRTENAAPIQSKTLDKGFLNSLQGLMDDGAFSKAAKHLLSTGLHDSADAEVRRALEALHPAREPIADEFPKEMWPVDTSPEGQRARLKALRQCMLQFPLGSAAGPSGLRPQLLSEKMRG